MFTPGIRLRSSARTSTGQVRENNEDNVHLWARDQFVLAIVADGMGGAAAGEEASRIAVEAVHEDFTKPDANDNYSYKTSDEDVLMNRLKTAIRSANHNIVHRALVQPEFKGMGTTLTLALVRGTDVMVAHVGDSRAYLIDQEEHEITQITSDHSFVEALVAAGHITREEAEDHPMRNVLYRALGQSEEVEVDFHHHHLHIGDRLVLCSDGLTRHVKREEIAQIALAEDNPDVTTQKLVDLANSRGGEDNISVVVIKVESGDNTEGETHIAMRDDETIVLRDSIIFNNSSEAETTPTHPDTRPKAILEDLDTFIPFEEKNLSDAPTLVARPPTQKPPRDADREGHDKLPPDH